ncbi:MAG TPA: hypothetical protein DDY91_09110 [Planctomycetaceae bacterium]|jgi:hypothetical protein|nr:hypothetical protein [Planctomycetaceae bacterium]
MTKNNRRKLGPVIGVLLAVLATPVAWSCYVAPRPGDYVQIAQETAVILWDAEHQVEHFIRQGSFATSSRDFGFLVPTPTVPEFSEVDNRLFSELKTLTAPQVIRKPYPRSAPAGGCGCHAFPGSEASRNAIDSPTPSAKAVTVHSEQTIAGQDVVVLSADDAGAISEWLQEHEYAIDESLTTWMTPYVEQGWKITAFRFSRAETATGDLQSQAVCLSFATGQPFYPYREPPPSAAVEEQARQGRLAERLLRVYFLGSERVEGRLGAEKLAWPGRTLWSRDLTDEEQSRGFAHLKLPGERRTGTWRLTEFEDRASPRPGSEDLLFFPSEDQSSFERPPVIEYVQRNETESRWLLIALAGGVIAWLRPRTRRA